MREREIEDYARRQIAEAGGLMLKWSSTAQRGVLDDIAFWPGAIHLIEFKQEKGRLEPLQLVIIRRLARFNVPIFVLYSLEEVDAYVNRHRLATAPAQSA